jgi:hypothetical protein
MSKTRNRKVTCVICNKQIKKSDAVKVRFVKGQIRHACPHHNGIESVKITEEPCDDT